MVRGALMMLALLARSESCGFEDLARDVGDPCTRDVDCGDELTCRAGLCQEPEVDAGLPDGGMPGDAGMDDGST